MLWFYLLLKQRASLERARYLEFNILRKSYRVCRLYAIPVALPGPRSTGLHYP